MKQLFSIDFLNMPPAHQYHAFDQYLYITLTNWELLIVSTLGHIGPRIFTFMRLGVAHIPEHIGCQAHRSHYLHTRLSFRQ